MSIATGTQRDGGFPWRLIGWGLAASLLLLPLAAMQFTDEVHWTVFDFAFAVALFGLVGGAFELAVRRSASFTYRCGSAAALLAALLIVWANGAVGMIGNEDNRYNLFFLGVIALAVIGAVAVRFRASGLAVVMGVAGVSQIVLAAIGAGMDARGGIFSTLLASFWLLSAGFFRAAAHSRR
jgi:hypothetical protein